MKSVAIVLGRPHDVIGRAIDTVTGRRGWSHVCLDVGLPSFGVPSTDRVLVDIDRDYGVVLSRWSFVFADRETLSIPVPDRWATYVRRRIIARIGEPYSLVAMALQPLGLDAIPGAYCSRVVRDVLPEVMQRRLPKVPSPSDFLALQ